MIWEEHKAVFFWDILKPVGIYGHISTFISAVCDEPEHPVMDLGEMIELMKEEVMLGADFSLIDFLFDNTAMALAELYFQWKDNGKLDYDHEEAIWD